MKYIIKYHEDVISDIKKIGGPEKKYIKKAIEEKLVSRPEVFGKPLRKSLKNYRKLRVGDYRVVFRIENEKVIIFAILHRSVVYEKISKRCL